jgi:hypothetical protein
MSSIYALKVVILYPKTNEFGLKKDADILEKALRDAGVSKILRCDPLEVPEVCDCAFHLEQPIGVWMPWARTNVLFVNPEWYSAAAYNSYLPHFDRLVFKNESARSRFCGGEGVPFPREKSILLPWATPVSTETDVKEQNETKLGFACFLGASQNRHKFITKILPFWRPQYPQLNVFSVTPLDISGAAYAEQENINFRVVDLDEKQHARLSAFFPGHLVVSASEGYCYTAGEAENVGAFAIHNKIEAFMQSYSGEHGVAWIPCTQSRQDPAHELSLVAKLVDREDVQTAMDRAIQSFFSQDMSLLRQQRKAAAAERRTAFTAGVLSLITDLQGVVKTLPRQARPPILKAEDCPPITVVTLLYNRRRFFELACHNMLLSDYPKDKIEWIVVEDSDDPAEDASDRVVQVQQKSDPLKLVYVPLKKKMSISEKRNLGVSRASNDIVLMMDDDDHYPETSFRRRVAWLTLHPWKPQATVCTTIACYDLVKAISAVNVPPFDLPLSQRISEATLTFYKAWWAQRQFEQDVQVGEGELFLRDREHEVLEMPPQQIIVAFSHGKNTSSRRVPQGADVNPGCFWGFPREFLIFIHELAGIRVEERRE